jgi:hypothetical protein
MDALKKFIKNYIYLSELRNIDPTNPIKFELEPDLRKFIMVCSFLEPTFSQLPYNVLWLVYGEDPWAKKVFLRKSHMSADSRKGTWIEINSMDELYGEDQYYRKVPDSSALDLGIDGDFLLGPATKDVLGYVKLGDIYEGKTTVVSEGHEGLTDARTPLDHDHTQSPATMIHVSGHYTNTTEQEDSVGDTETFVSIDLSSYPITPGSVFFLTGFNETRPNEWFGEWRLPRRSDVLFDNTSLESATISLEDETLELRDNSIRKLVASGLYTDGTLESKAENILWTIETNTYGVEITSTGVLILPDLDSDLSIEVYADITDEFNSGRTVRGMINLFIKDTYTAVVPVSLFIVGPTDVPEDSTQSYVFRVTFSDETTKDFNPDSVSSSNPIANLNLNGNLVILGIDSPGETQLGASLVINGLTLKAELTVNLIPSIVAQSISIVGPSSIDEESSAAYTFNVTMSDGSDKEVEATQASSTIGVLSSNGLFTSPRITEEQIATLFVQYTENGVSLNSLLDVRVLNSSNLPVSIATSGPQQLDEGGSEALLTTRVSFEDGSSTETTSIIYTVESGESFASVEGNTVVSKNVESDQSVEIKSTYVSDYITLTSNHIIIIKFIEPVLESIEIIGASEVDEGSNLILTAVGTLSSGSTIELTLLGFWSIVDSPINSSIEKGLFVSSLDETSDTVVTIKFTYLSIETDHTITIKNVIPPGPQASWGYDTSGEDVWPYTKSFIENLPNKLDSPILGQTLSLGPNSGHFYIAIPESEISGGKALQYHFNGSSNFSVWGGARWPDVGFFGSSRPASIDVDGIVWHIYRTDLPGMAGPDSYALVENNMPAT